MKRHYILLALIALALIAGCRKDDPITPDPDPVPHDDPTPMPPADYGPFTDFTLIAPTDGDSVLYGTERVMSDAAGLKVIYRYGSDISALRAVFHVPEGAQVFVGSTPQVSGQTINDFSMPVTYRVVSDGRSVDILVSVMFDTKLPTVYITTATGQMITSRDEWLHNNTIRIRRHDGWMEYLANSNADARARGNLTWHFPKLPYSFKLPSKQSVLGMPAHKRWHLLAGYADHTGIRNSVAFEIARRTHCFDWTPSGKHVDVVVNGRHMGNYLLVEAIKADPNRLNIGNDGYLIEFDKYFDETYKFRTATFNLPVCVKEPGEDEITTAQFSYIQDYVNHVETLLHEDSVVNGAYMDYLDLDSYLAYWMVNELTVCREANRPSSVYMHKTATGKLMAGPVWDYDYGTFREENDRYCSIEACWNSAFLYHDRNAIIRARTLWNEIRPQLLAVDHVIDSLANLVRESKIKDNALWPYKERIAEDANMEGNLNYDFDACVASLKEQYHKRILWMDHTVVNLKAPGSGNPRSGGIFGTMRSHRRM